MLSKNVKQHIFALNLIFQYNINDNKKFVSIQHDL